MGQVKPQDSSVLAKYQLSKVFDLGLADVLHNLRIAKRQDGLDVPLKVRVQSLIDPRFEVCNRFSNFCPTSGAPSSKAC